ncbi:MAG: carboxymuconolactone decarboxylase family protein, partial [Novosphingobium sp.]|nr:carboxymuconolactone decarboxylase family protein [Novosphingobium sp.]
FNEEETALLRACDELKANNNVSDETWAALSQHFTRHQLMDLVFMAGHYLMTSWALKAFGVPLEGGADAIGFDLATKSGSTPGATYKPGETEDWIATRGY